MRRTHRVMAALAVTSGALGACNLITGLNADYSAVAFDGATAPFGEGGGGDGPASDGGGMDVSTNDGKVVDGALLSFCEAAQGDSAPGDFFCTDFENDAVGSMGPHGWDSQTNNIGEGGTITLLDGIGVDASHALEVKSDTMDASVYRQLRLDKNFSNDGAPDTFKSFEVQLHFRVVTSAVNYDAFALLVFRGTSTNENGIAGYKIPNGHEISHEGPLNDAAVVVNDEMWHTAEILLVHETAGTPFFRSISFDDGARTIEDKTPNHTFDPSAVPVFSIGTFNTATSPGLSWVQFDNIVVRRRRFP